jgi:hypothetical protein
MAVACFAATAAAAVLEHLRRPALRTLIDSTLREQLQSRLAAVCIKVASKRDTLIGSSTGD